jgi:uncharacterized repeat protein (TIGR01451 family)
MNYTFQVSGIGPTDPDGPAGPLTGRVDYSGETLPTLVENNLSEPAGIGDGTDTTFSFCPGSNNPDQPGAGMGPVDWDCDKDGGTEASVSTDVNGDAAISCVDPGSNGVLDTPPDPGDVVIGNQIFEGPNRQCDTVAVAKDVQNRPVGPLVGFNDWAGIKYDFQNTSDFEDGAHTLKEVQLRELDYATFSEQIAPDPAVSKAGAPELVLTGSDIHYAITLSNTHPSAARDVTVSDVLPTQTTFVSCTATGGGVCGGSGNSRTVTFASLGAGVSEAIALVAKANCNVPNGTVIANTAKVSSVTPDSDPSNNSSLANVTASNPPPVISEVSVDEATLWPSNHKMRDVEVSYTVKDNCGPVACSLDATSNESADGLGDGHSSPDIEIVDDRHLRLRAERSGRGGGRVYTITVSCTDSSGASSSAKTEVNVPHATSTRAPRVPADLSGGRGPRN